MKKFKNVRPNDIIVVNTLNTNMYCVVNHIVKYDDVNNLITLEITNVFTQEKYITPELYMNTAHVIVIDDKCNTYTVTMYNYDTFCFMHGFSFNYNKATHSYVNVPIYYKELMKAKYGTDTNFVDDATYERDNVDNRHNQNMISDTLDNIIQEYDELAGYYQYIQRVRPKRIEKIVLHVV